MFPTTLIERNPTISGGEPVIHGTRVPLRTVLASLADGDSIEQIVQSFPTLTRELVTAVIAFAAAAVEDDLPIPAAAGRVMKIKLDENLPTELALMLRDRKHDVHTVPDELLAGRDDSIVFAASVAEDRLLITQDLDFSDTRKFKPGSHPGIVLIRLKHASRRQLIERFQAILEIYEIGRWSSCFVVLSDNKLRVRTPKPGN